MKKTIYLSSIFFLSAIFLITSCSEKEVKNDDKEEEKTDKEEDNDNGWALMDDCASQLAAQMEEDDDEEEAAYLDSLHAVMNIPSEIEVSTCLCEKFYASNPNATDEDLNTFLNNEPEGEEIAQRMEEVMQCMGFDSFQDYLTKMMEIEMADMME